MKPIANTVGDLFQPRELAKDEYLNEADGLIYCSKCHTPRQHRIELKERVFLPTVRCRCQQEEYDKEELKRLRNRIIIKNYRKPNRGEIEDLIQIYVQLSRFTNAKAIVREIYYELPNKNDEKRIMSGIEEQELSYNIMKYLKNGMSVEQIAENLHLYTVDAIKEVNKQKELNNEIKIMHKEGKSEVDIAELLNENIQRVKWGLESKNKEQSITEKDGNER